MTGDYFKLVHNVALVKAAVPDLASWLKETNVYSDTKYRSIALVNVPFINHLEYRIPSKRMAQICICSFAQSSSNCHNFRHNRAHKGLDSTLYITPVRPCPC